MDKEIVIMAPTEEAAYQVVKALHALDDDGSIELYSSTVVVKRTDGSVDVKDTRSRTPWGTALGVSTGALVGLLAGPVGVAVGAVVGGAAGLGADIAYSGFAGEFVNDVSARLKPGTEAVCASIWEDWTVPVDVAVAPFGAIVFRQSTDDVVVAQIRAEMQALAEERAHLETEIAQAKDSEKTKLEARRDELRAKQTAQRERLQKRARKLEESWDAKVASIKEKAASAKTEAKARHERHIEKLGKFVALQKQSFRELFG
jgi:uncharacterized membrane protein